MLVSADDLERSLATIRANAPLVGGRFVNSLAVDSAFAVGKWHLDRDSGPVGGVFSLVFRQFPEGWRIIADHTSVVPAAPGAPGE